MAGPGLGDDGAGVSPGDLLAGKYRVERVLGVGGMGVVVAAHHVQLDTKVALKFLRAEALGNPEAVGRFVREARAAVKITGEHVARVSDVGQLENGSPYIVMEYLEGIDLSTWLKQRGALPIELTVDFVLQACEAVADAHALGIVHRDLKPANLFCVVRTDGQPCIKVLDFGISKLMTPGLGDDMTRTSALLGSPFYMSPEQMQSSKGVDARTDIWSLGIILFELMSGQTPFRADAITELAIKIAVDPAPLVRAFRADVPPGLEHVIATCLQKDRAWRYQTVGDLAIALREFGSRLAGASVERVLGTLRQAGISTSVPPPSGELRGASSVAPALPEMAPQTGASWGQTGRNSIRPNGRAAALFTVGAVVVLGGLGAGALFLVRQRAPVPTAAAAAPPVLGPSTVPPDVVPPEVPLGTLAATAPSVGASVGTPSAAPTARPVTPDAATRSATPSVRATATAGSSPAVATTSTPPKPNCTPPFFFDSAGHKQYKPECM